MAVQTPSSTVDDLRAEVDGARAELMSSLLALRSQANGPALARRAGGAVRDWFTSEDGSPRIDRIAAVGGVAVGLVVIRALTRRR